ncbi:MAG TPA: DUF1634 domain-containing protein [Dehalococcoidales bacterium]|nr:DUF1634 domain-containing protein [Dehalococcoidales bacterium]
MNFNNLGSGDSGLENGISYLLVAGLIISLVLEITGVALLYLNNHSLEISQDPSMFIRGNDFFTFFIQQLRGENSHGIALRLMTLGIIVLILTPFIRLVMSVVYFGWEKNIKYVLITFFVLVVITISLVLH